MAEMLHYWPICETCGEPGYCGAGQEAEVYPVGCQHASCSEDGGFSTHFARRSSGIAAAPFAPCCASGTHDPALEDQTFPEKV